MIEPVQQGICAFLCQIQNGIIHFLVQLKYECGNHDILEIGPTIQQTVDDNLSNNIFYSEIIDPKNKILLDSLQSEEG